MEKFSYRDHQVLGHNSPRKSFGNLGSSPKIPLANSEVDFNDVFGGPPRRSSVHETRYSFSETLDSYAFRRGGEGAFGSRNSWSLGEKPVFGEDVASRRRYPSGDFFDDIFRGDGSSSSTPRKPDRDPFSSTPASRILSPARPLPPKSDLFGASSFPAQLSLPPRLAKGMDFPAFNTNPSRSPQRNNDGALSIALPSPQSAFMPRVSNQAIQDNPKNDARPSYRQSPLSYEFSFNKEGSLKAAKSDNEDMGGIKEKDLGSTQLNNDSSQFHFSIYKWASKGVPLVTPLRGLNGSMPKRKGKGESSSSSKEKGDNESNSGSIERGNNESSSSLVDSDKSESMINESSASILQGVGFLLPEERMSTVASSSQMGLEDQKNGSLDGTLTKDRTDSFRISVKLGLKPLDSLESITTEIPGSFVHNPKKEIEPGSGLYGSLSEIGPFQNTEKEINGSAHESCKPELVPLCPLLYENSSGQGTVSEIGAAKANVTSSVNVDDGKILKKHDSKRNIFNIAANSSLQDSSIDSEEKRGGKSVKGKVKEFVKIFSREASSKSTTDIDMQGQISRWKEINTCKAEEKVSNHATKTDGKVNIRNKEKPSTETFFMVDQALKQSENPDIEIDTDIHKFHHTSSERNNSSASLSGFEAALAHMEESHCEYLHGNCLGEDLSLDKSKQQLVEYQEEIQVSDARIQEWSNGKEGNIRSLLSTLQYVLWPESGWKPVPLVDIIEGNAVKRAYQKALLCLHPDKLQQKGVALHKKYIAEKVFDILQEAWNHFNSLGSF